MTQYAVLPIPARPAYQNSCWDCDGLGITGDRYEVPGDSGPTLLVDVICPGCGGCGNGDPQHADCPASEHAWPEDASDDLDDLEDLEDQLGNEPGPACHSCGSGRGWNPVQGFEPDAVLTLRMPCGCSVDRLVTGDDPDTLDSAPVRP